MTTTAVTTPGRTAWETAEYRRDHGHRAAVIQAHRDFADFLAAHRDSPVPPPGDIAVGVVFSVAAVDRWAARQHVTPEWKNGTYRAATDFEKVLTYCVVYIPPDVLDKRLDAQGAPEDSAEMAGSAVA